MLKFICHRTFYCHAVAVLCLIISSEGLSQKDLSRTYIDEGIERITIDANGVHSLKVVTASTDQITVNVHLEGETSEEIAIKEQISSKELGLGFGAWPFAKSWDDKLAAHKIVSVEVTIAIPEDLVVSITSNTAHVFAKGTFQFLYVDIEDENCILTHFTGDANLKTKNGTIQVSVQNNTTVAETRTTYGTVQNNLGESGVYTIYAESLYGDISLQQTQ